MVKRKASEGWGAYKDWNSSVLSLGIFQRNKELLFKNISQFKRNKRNM